MTDEERPEDDTQHPPPPWARSETRLSQAPTLGVTTRGLPAHTPDTFPPLPDGSMFGSYRILRLLGSGGMGAVYEAEDTAPGRRVALKVLARAGAPASTRQRFLREGRLAAQLSHPHTVYIYGTEEIDGQPVITMERVTGGTLDDRIAREGQLSARDAVDAILQVIAGLEAAAAVGILHRDVKPSNCFVDEDGTVKVGDFGLSISTEARDETQLTATGTIFGTPSYASPEQLQGEVLDVRSDLYSVGATLYDLLTGTPPFDKPNMVQLLSAILQENPLSPRTLRPEIPRGLARVVLRCLSKKPSSRYANYSDLAKALFPFSSSAHVVAPLGRRFVAGFTDHFLLGLFASGVFTPLLGLVGPGLGRVTGMLFVNFGLGLLYFGIAEGVWATTPGKATVQLRVIGLDHQPVAFSRAFLRASVFLFVPEIPTWIRPFWAWFQGPTPPPTVEASLARDWPWFLLSITLMALLFITARRRNGFAAVHDSWTGTRVVLGLAYEPQKLGSSAEEPPPAPGQALGRYRMDSGASVHEDETTVGWDPALRRRIWVRGAPAGAPAVSVARQELGRPGRLRWLGGQRRAGENWDAYEAPDGCSLASLAGSRQPWGRVRHWLVSLAEELQAALQDGSAPGEMTTDRIWIAPNDCCKLLDIPPPGATTCRTTLRAPTDETTARQFLFQVALLSLEGGVRTETAQRGQTPRVPLPLHARAFLTGLHSGESVDLSSVIERLKLLCHKSPVVTREQRGNYAVGLAAFPTILFLIGLLGLFFTGELELGELPSLLGGFSLIALTLQCPAGLVCAFLLRGGLLLSRIGIAVVGPDGAPASRLRTTLRSLAGWSPMLLWLMVPVSWQLLYGTPLHGGYDVVALAEFMEGVTVATPDFSYRFGIVVLAIYLIGMIRFVASSARTPQDHVARTFLVPR